MEILHASFYQEPEFHILLKNVQLAFRHSGHQTAKYADNVNFCRRINYFQILDHSNVTLFLYLNTGYGSQRNKA